MRDIKEVMEEMSEEERNRIFSLPPMEYVIGATAKRGFFDKENNTLYCTNNEYTEIIEILKFNNDKVEPMKYTPQPSENEEISDTDGDPVKKVLG